MRSYDIGSKNQPFPRTRPVVEIKPHSLVQESVDCSELRWWSVIPERNPKAFVADYYPPNWSLTNVRELTTVRAFNLHGLDGVQIDVRDWTPESG